MERKTAVLALGDSALLILIIVAQHLLVHQQRKYKHVAEQGYKGVLSKVSTGNDGLTNIYDIREGTNVGDLAYYFNRNMKPTISMVSADFC